MSVLVIYGRHLTVAVPMFRWLRKSCATAEKERVMARDGWTPLRPAETALGWARRPNRPSLSPTYSAGSSRAWNGQTRLLGSRR